MSPTSIYAPITIDYKLSPTERPDSLVRPCAEIRTNRFGVKTCQYEAVKGGMGRSTGWSEYECHCGTKFWRRSAFSAVRSCGRCGIRGRGVVNDLSGQVFTKLTVLEHEPAKGWKTRCVCGREKTITSATLLTSGAIKSCGLCRNEVPWQWPINQQKRDEDTDLMPITPTPENPTPADWHLKRCTSSMHPIDPGTKAYPLIMYVERTGEQRDCPLCMALAKIEMMED